jgi:hypothetical protein
MTTSTISSTPNHMNKGLGSGLRVDLSKKGGKKVNYRSLDLAWCK